MSLTIQPLFCPRQDATKPSTSPIPATSPWTIGTGLSMRATMQTSTTVPQSPSSSLAGAFRKRRCSRLLTTSTKHSGSLRENRAFKLRVYTATVRGTSSAQSRPRWQYTFRLFRLGWSPSYGCKRRLEDELEEFTTHRLRDVGICTTSICFSYRLNCKHRIPSRSSMGTTSMHIELN